MIDSILLQFLNPSFPANICRGIYFSETQTGINNDNIKLNQFAILLKKDCRTYVKNHYAK